MLKLLTSKFAATSVMTDVQSQNDTLAEQAVRHARIHRGASLFFLDSTSSCCWFLQRISLERESL